MRIHNILSVFFSCICWATLTYPAQATTYKINGDVVGEIKYYNVKPGDNLYAIARRFDIGIVELLATNPGIDAWKPEKGTELAIPTSHILPGEAREGIIINLSELRLFYFPDAHHVVTFPIGIGRDGWETQQGITKIVRKREHPTWTPPDSIREVNPDLPDIVPAGPDNPLGDYALSLGWTNYVIHGTNRPYSVGKRSSHGCIRLYPEDIARLFKAVKEGTRVTVIDVPYKLGWQGDKLFIEVTPTQEQTDIIAKYKIPEPLAIPELYSAINEKAGTNLEIDWSVVDKAVEARSGVPTVISKN